MIWTGCKQPANTTNFRTVPDCLSVPHLVVKSRQCQTKVKLALTIRKQKTFYIKKTVAFLKGTMHVFIGLYVCCKPTSRKQNLSSYIACLVVLAMPQNSSEKSAYNEFPMSMNDGLRSLLTDSLNLHFVSNHKRFKSSQLYGLVSCCMAHSNHSEGLRG